MGVSLVQPGGEDLGRKPGFGGAAWRDLNGAGFQPQLPALACGVWAIDDP
jgi:hypothetical protein